MEQLEPEIKKICRACGILKREKSFGKMANGNRGNVCNICKANGRRAVRTKEVVVVKKKNLPLTMFATKKDDYILMYNFLSKIGYSLERSIHEQFCEKHNLKVKVRKDTFQKHYSPKDCGLI